jgi:glycerophosphoryl diester phosphodiesterase
MGGYQGVGFNAKGWVGRAGCIQQNKEFFDYIELDFNVTSDGVLICMHGYGEDRHRYIFGEVIEEIISFRKFQELNENGELTACDQFSLNEWLLQNPEKFIVTDIKESGRNVEILENLLETSPSLSQNLIPQAYSFEEVFSLHELGFENVILTTYRMGPLNEGNFLRQAEEAPLFAVTMTSGQAGYLSAELARRGIPTYVHTVNDHDWFARLRELAVSNIYTDVLSDTVQGY